MLVIVFIQYTRNAFSRLKSKKLWPPYFDYSAAGTELMGHKAANHKVQVAIISHNLKHSRKRSNVFGDARF